MDVETLPFPPFEMRELVGVTDTNDFDNPGGNLVFPELDADKTESVFDFGCGCGRLARQLIQQNPRPSRYVGIDIHKGMILWCRRNLSSFAPDFEFHHHNVWNIGLNPDSTNKTLPFPVEDHSFKLVIACSVFTHLVESQVTHYLKEVARILKKDGVFYSTWFIFDKSEYPMMQEFQNALYINDIDLTNAVIFDRTWLKSKIAEAGLSLQKITPPFVRGFQWTLYMSLLDSNSTEVEFPPDLSPIGVVRPPVPKTDASKIGLD